LTILAWVPAITVCLCFTQVASAQPYPAHPYALDDTTVWNTNAIPVCWDSVRSRLRTERDWIREALARTWVKETALTFSDWGPCGFDSLGIRINLGEDGPDTKALGAHLDVVPNGMLLPVDPASVWPVCAEGGETLPGYGTVGSMPAKSEREYCLKLMAVHQFGHALGIVHEPSPPDAPPACRESIEGLEGNASIPAGDHTSIMNYCDPNWQGNGYLIAAEIDPIAGQYGRDPSSLPDLDTRVIALSTVPGGSSVYTVGSDRSIWSFHYDPSGPSPAWTDAYALSPPDFSASRDVTALSTVPGGTSLYTIGQDGAVWTCFFDPRVPDAKWSDWYSLGGAELFGPVAATTRITALSTVFEGTSIYAVGHDGAVWTKYYVPGGSGFWSEWIRMSEAVRPGSHVTALMTVAGGTSLYTVGHDNAVWTRFFDPRLPNAQWSEWYSLGGNVKDGSDIAAISTVPGGTSLFVVGPNGTVESNYFDPRMPNAAWSGWFTLGGAPKDDSSVTAISALPGGTQIFIVGPDGEVNTRFFDPRQSNPIWSDWYPVAGGMRSADVRGGDLQVAAISTVPGGISLFAKRDDGYVVSNYIDARVENRWVGWFPVGR
jgi:hypothetical protein